MRLDHIVLWTQDPRAAIDFYSRVVGLTPLRYAEFEAGEAPFPSVRVSEDSIIDLMPVELAPGGNGHPVNHVCLALSRSGYDALDQRLHAAGVDISVRLAHSYGARGWAPQTYYFADPDGNVIEARYYE
jgi:catechol 2,3-dioxygenase-like lactoylglutathione lyase family enzyme